MWFDKLLKCYQNILKNKTRFFPIRFVFFLTYWNSNFENIPKCTAKLFEGLKYILSIWRISKTAKKLRKLPLVQWIDHNQQDKECMSRCRLFIFLSSLALVLSTNPLLSNTVKGTKSLLASGVPKTSDGQPIQTKCQNDLIIFAEWGWLLIFVGHVWSKICLQMTIFPLLFQLT